MPLKIKHPKKNGLVKRRHFVANGKCENSSKVSGYLKRVSDSAIFQGTPLGSTKKKHWGLIFKNIPAAAYKLHVDEATTISKAKKGNDQQKKKAAAASSDEIPITVTPAPVPGAKPDIAYPVAGDSVSTVFSPYGTSGTNIVDPNGLSFHDAAGANQRFGSLTQQVDAFGFWYGIVENLETWPTAPPYELDVSNSAGPSTNGNITITP